MRHALVAAFAAILALVGCSTISAVQNAANTPVTANEIANAQAASVALEGSYDASLTIAIAWAKLPACGSAASAAPLCSTAAGVLTIEGIRVKARTALDALNAAIANTSTSSSQLSAAIAAAQTAYGAYQQIVNSTKGAS